MAKEVANGKANTSFTKPEKLEKAISLKNEGNCFYKIKDYRNAMKKYHRAILYVKGLNKQQPFENLLDAGNGEREMSEEFKQKAQETESSCYNNLAGTVY